MKLLINISLVLSVLLPAIEASTYHRHTSSKLRSGLNYRYKEPTCGQRSFTSNLKIVGGEKATVESHPWIATLFRSNRTGLPYSFICGGSLIHPCWVLTAAHCFYAGPPQTSKYIVILGMTAIDATNKMHQMFYADKVIIHGRYIHSKGVYDNDIALIRIRSATGQCAKESNIVKTICLPSQYDVLRDRSQCEISGYGKESQTDLFSSGILKSAYVYVVPQSLCRKYYGNRVLTDNMFCAAGLHWRTDSCSGDSGGPLICDFSSRIVQYGIVSWGYGCAIKDKPGVYTRLINYLPWIKSHMNGVDFKSNYPPK